MDVVAGDDPEADVPVAGTAAAAAEAEAAARDAAALAKAAAKAAEAISVSKDDEEVVENKGILISNETGVTK